MGTTPTNMDRYAVMGYPVQHSWSPFIHGMFAKQTGQALVYSRIEVPPEQLAHTVEQFFAQGGKGLNITVPHKQAAADLVRWRTPRASIAGAINTIAAQDDGLLGDNTDGAGLINDLTRNLHLQLADTRILILGAGGAARGVLGPLLAAAPARLEVVNRNVERAMELVEEFEALGEVHGCGFDNLARKPFDLVINATSASLQGATLPVPAEIIGRNTVCYDMAYGKGDTSFTRWAKQAGAARAEMGWGMLVEQAAEAFELWRGVRPETAPVLKALTSPPPPRQAVI